MNFSAPQILLGFYLGTVLINIIVVLIQYFNDREKIHKLTLFYWSGILVSSLANMFSANLDILKTTLISPSGTFASQLVLALCLGEIRDVHIKIGKLLGFYLVSMGITLILFFYGQSVAIYSFPIAFGATTPVFYVAYLVLIGGGRPLTLVQKMFLVITLIMSFHYLDWPFFRTHPELFFIGLAVAFALIYVQSILMPMMVNEKVLQMRNEKLEEEVHFRASQVTEAQNQLWSSNKLASIGRMAGGVAHEINNPLTIINMCADTMHDEALNGTLKSQEVVEKTAKIHESVERISKITTGLRKVAKDHRSMERSENDLGIIISETLAFCKDRMRILDIAFGTDIPSQPMPILCNSAEISQIILNLLNNAIDAISAQHDKSIRLAVVIKNGFYELSVQDSGSVDPSMALKIMDPFFSSKPLGQGAGLGLSIGRAIAENHGGRLFLDMKSANTRFVLELPRFMGANAESWGVHEA